MGFYLKRDNNGARNISKNLNYKFAKCENMFIKYFFLFELWNKNVFILYFSAINIPYEYISIIDTIITNKNIPIFYHYS